MKQVYFARVVGTDGPIKIGCSDCPSGRGKQLGFDVAASVEILATAPGDYILERNLLLKFAAHRVAGPTHPTRGSVAGATEWFSPNPELLLLIETVAQTGKIELPIDQCRERVIAARYKSGETLEKIGSSLGITRERVRQILASLGIERRSAAERAYIQRLERQKRFAAWMASRQAA